MTKSNDITATFTSRNAKEGEPVLFQNMAAAIGYSLHHHKQSFTVKGELGRHFTGVSSVGRNKNGTAEVAVLSNGSQEKLKPHDRAYDLNGNEFPKHSGRPFVPAPQR